MSGCVLSKFHGCSSNVWFFLSSVRLTLDSARACVHSRPHSTMRCEFARDSLLLQHSRAIFFRFFCLPFFLRFRFSSFFGLSARSRFLPLLLRSIPSSRLINHYRKFRQKITLLVRALDTRLTAQQPASACFLEKTTKTDHARLIFPRLRYSFESHRCSYRMKFASVGGYSGSEILTRRFKHIQLVTKIY